MAIHAHGYLILSIMQVQDRLARVCALVTTEYETINKVTVLGQWSKSEAGPRTPGMSSRFSGVNRGRHMNGDGLE